MTKTLCICLLMFCIASCRFTSEKKHAFVNEALMVSQIRAVQPAKNIEMSLQTQFGRDSMIIIKLEVDPNIPDKSLNVNKAKLVLGSILTSLSDLKSYSSCKVIFVKKTGSKVTESKSIEYLCPITPLLLTNIKNYKDSTKTSVGYIDTSWTYINKDLSLSIPLKKDWYYMSLENDSLVFYSIGTNINELPQYKTDTDMTVGDKTLNDLVPGNVHPLFSISKTRELFSNAQQLREYCPSIVAGLVINRYPSEDEYIKALYQLMVSKALAEKDIRSFHFGGVVFRGVSETQRMKNGKSIVRVWTMKQFRRVSLVFNFSYTNEKEFEEIKDMLNKLVITQDPA